MADLNGKSRISIFGKSINSRVARNNVILTSGMVLLTMHLTAVLQRYTEITPAIMAALYCLIVVLTCVVSRHFSKRLTEPVNRLTKDINELATKDMAKAGKDVIKAKLTINSGDELELLSDAYRRLIGKLVEYLEYTKETENNIALSEGKRTMDRRFIKAVSPICTSFFEVDLERDEIYRYNPDSDNDVFIQKTNMSFTDYVRYAAANWIHPDSREEFVRSCFDLNFREIVKTDDARIVCVYKRLVEGSTFRWYTAWLHPIEDSEGKRRIFFFAQDINEQINDRREQEEKLKKANTELSEAIKEAERASKAKTEFLSNMSHDIRTPMNTIVGLVNLAQGHLDEPEKVSEYLEKMRTASKHLIGIINDILDMAYIDSGRLTIKENRCRLTSIVRDVGDIMRPQMEGKHQKFTINMESISRDCVMIDEGRMKQVMINILGNSYKFTPEGGSVTLDISETDTIDPNTVVVHMTFSDTGAGMPPEFAERLFERFERENTSTISKIEGTGLGMAITKSILDKMHGRIAVRSTVGEGTVFTVDIPLTACDDPAKASASMPDISSDEVISLQGRKILLAEDNELNAEITKTLLEDIGAWVDVVGDGRKAVNRFMSTQPWFYDVVLMDIKMPVMDGYEAARAIRKIDSDYAKRIPIFAVTADAFTSDIEAAEAAGMNDHVPKPIDMKLLSHKISELGRDHQ